MSILGSKHLRGTDGKLFHKVDELSILYGMRN